MAKHILVVFSSDPSRQSNWRTIQQMLRKITATYKAACSNDTVLEIVPIELLIPPEHDPQKLEDNALYIEVEESVDTLIIISPCRCCWPKRNTYKNLVGWIRKINGDVNILLMFPEERIEQFLLEIEQNQKGFNRRYSEAKPIYVM